MLAITAYALTRAERGPGLSDYMTFYTGHCTFAITENSLSFYENTQIKTVSSLGIHLSE